MERQDGEAGAAMSKTKAKRKATMKKEQTENIPCYVGIKSCGCVVFAQVDDPEMKADKAYQRDIAKAVAKCIREGLTIEKRSVGWVRNNFKGCKCDEKPERKPRERPVSAKEIHSAIREELV